MTKSVVIYPKDVQEFKEALSDGLWHKSAALTHIGDERRLRAVAAASVGRIISGQKGYKLTAKSNRDEISHCANWLRHQAGLMIARAAEIENAHQQEGQGTLFA